jgi:hypothetical protein
LDFGRTVTISTPAGRRRRLEARLELQRERDDAIEDFEPVPLHKMRARRRRASARDRDRIEERAACAATPPLGQHRHRD